MACSKTALSFAEIVQGREASVRVTDDNLIYAVDLVMVVTGKDRDHAGQALRGISDEIFSSLKISERNTGGSGNTRTKLVSFEHAIELVMVLPGKVAKETRVQFANIIRRYMAGDKELISEVISNANSNSPLAQMARASLGQEPVAEELVGFKRRREELELFKLEEEIRGMTQARIIAATAEIERIRDPARSNLDDRTRLMIQDAMQNSILNTTKGQQGGGLALTNGPSPNAPISISSVAAALGYRPTSDDAKRVGVELRKRYLKLHGNPPPKHDQLCDGRVTSVNSYTEQDRQLMEDTLHAYFRVEDE